MRVFFDTNVLISAFTTRGVCADIFEHCIYQHKICTSEYIIKELKKVLKTKFKMSDTAINQVTTLLKENAIVIPSDKIKKRICRDPKDDQVLNDATVCQARAILSGDKDLLVLKQFESIPIIEPKNFWSFEKI